MKYLLSILLLFSLSFCLAQNEDFDKIHKKDLTILEGKILKVTSTPIEFDPKGDIPFLIIERKDVNGLTYKNGTKVIFEEHQNTSGNNNTSLKNSYSHSPSQETPLSYKISTFSASKDQKMLYRHDEYVTKKIRIPTGDNTSTYNVKANIKFDVHRPFVGGRHVKFSDIDVHFTVQELNGNVIIEKNFVEKGPIQGKFGSWREDDRKTTDFNLENFRLGDTIFKSKLKIEFLYNVPSTRGQFESHGLLVFGKED